MLLMNAVFLYVFSAFFYIIFILNWYAVVQGYIKNIEIDALIV